VSPFFLEPDSRTAGQQARKPAVRQQPTQGRQECLRYKKTLGLRRGLEFPGRSLRADLDTGGRWIQSVALCVSGIAGPQNLANDPSRRGSTSMLGGSANRQVRQVLKPLESGIQNRSSRDVFHMHHF